MGSCGPATASSSYRWPKSLRQGNARHQGDGLLVTSPWEGLVEGRPGVGTFVLKTLGGPRLADNSHLRRRLTRWVAAAREAGLDEESISALFDATLRGSLHEEG